MTAIVCSPLVFGPQALPALGALGAKGELTRISKAIFNRVTSKQESDYIARLKRMEIAYGLICFTAFYEALDEKLPDELRQEIALQAGEKANIARQATERQKKEASEDQRQDITEASLAKSCGNGS